LTYINHKFSWLVKIDSSWMTMMLVLFNFDRYNILERPEFVSTTFLIYFNLNYQKYLSGSDFLILTQEILLNLYNLSKGSTWKQYIAREMKVLKITFDSQKKWKESRGYTQNLTTMKHFFLLLKSIFSLIRHVVFPWMVEWIKMDKEIFYHRWV